MMSHFEMGKKTKIENPVLIGGLSLGPVIAISQSLKAGVSLSVAFSIIIIPVLLIIFGILFPFFSTFRKLFKNPH